MHKADILFELLVGGLVASALITAAQCDNATLSALLIAIAALMTIPALCTRPLPRAWTADDYAAAREAATTR